MKLNDIDDWQYEVANGDTVLGLTEWYEHKLEAESHETCVVQPSAMSAEFVSTSDPMCGKPMVGQRGGFRMCAEHFEMFDPQKVPQFEHDCESCIFLGRWEDRLAVIGHYDKYDLYVCPGEFPTVIARYSDEGPDYSSGIEFVGRIDALTEAARRALKLIPKKDGE